MALRLALCIGLTAAPGIAVDSAPNAKRHMEAGCILALAPSVHSATVQANRGEQRVDSARQRTTPVSGCILRSDLGPDRGRGSLVAVVAPLASLLYAKDAESGRSPPVSLLGK